MPEGGLRCLHPSTPSPAKRMSEAGISFMHTCSLRLAQLPDPGPGAVRVELHMAKGNEANRMELSPVWEGWVGTRLPLRGGRVAGGGGEDEGLAMLVFVLVV